MNKNYSFDIINNTLTVSKSFLKAASKLNTPEYRIVKALRADYPNLTVATTEPRKGKKKISFAQMADYIKLMDEQGKTDSAYEKQFAKVKALSKIQASPYNYVKTWFENTFPNYQQQVTFDEEGRIHYPAELVAAIQPKQQDKPGTVSVPNADLALVPQTDEAIEDKDAA